MELRKRMQPERRRYVLDHERSERPGDPLFEREWEIFVVRFDPEKGRYLTETVHEEPQPEPA